MSWEQLTEILRENREQRRQDALKVPVVCPIDGEPLDVHPDGRRNCKFGNYTYP